MFQEIAPHDPESLMREEWLNARGAIARFGRGSIEIRVIDSPNASRMIWLSRRPSSRSFALAEERWSSRAKQLALPQGLLVQTLARTIQAGPEAMIEGERSRRGFGIKGTSCRAGDVWNQLVEDRLEKPEGIHPQWSRPLEVILSEGPLSVRLIEATHGLGSRFGLRSAYTQLADSLHKREMFVPMS